MTSILLLCRESMFALSSSASNVLVLSLKMHLMVRSFSFSSLADAVLHSAYKQWSNR